jgi:CheY-like chemotaxis protein
MPGKSSEETNTYSMQLVHETEKEMGQMRRDLGVLSAATGITTETGHKFRHLNFKPKPQASYTVPPPRLLKFSSDQPTVKFRKKTIPSILIVDDNLLHAMASKIIFERAGCTAQIAANGKQALEILEQKVFDIVFLDGDMPVMDGPETCEVIRYTEEAVAKHSFRMFVVGMFTQDDTKDEELMEDAYSSGMDRFIVKPLLTHAKMFTSILSLGSVGIEAFRRTTLERNWTAKYGDVHALFKGPLEQSTAVAAVTAASTEQQKQAQRMLNLFELDERRQLEDCMGRQALEVQARQQANIVRLKETVQLLEEKLEEQKEELAASAIGRVSASEQFNQQTFVTSALKLKEMQRQVSDAAHENARLNEQVTLLKRDIRNLLDNGCANQKVVNSAVARVSMYQRMMEASESRMFEWEEEIAAMRWHNYYGCWELRMDGLPPKAALDTSASWYADEIRKLNGTMTQFAKTQTAAAHQLKEYMVQRAARDQPLEQIATNATFPTTAPRYRPKQRSSKALPIASCVGDDSTSGQ